MFAGELRVLSVFLQCVFYKCLLTNSLKGEVKLEMSRTKRQNKHTFMIS